ncbi:MAG: hypothetical protein M1450_01780 [Patescibacteria group bacterium]|nr:hypothetical protein [Patescibacteria group bacterium]
MGKVKDPKVILLSFIVILISLFGLFHYLNILRLDYAFPSLSFIPHLSEEKLKTTPVPRQNISPTPVISYLETCSVKKEGNPLVEDVKKVDDKTIIGTFRGNITKITVHLDSTADIDLYSIRGGQGHTFKVKEEKGLVYNAVNLKDLTLLDLNKGNTVTMSFNCFPTKGLFKITRISVTGRM